MLLTLLNSIVNCLRAKIKLSLILARLQTGKMDWDSFIMLFDTIHAILLLIVYEKKLNCLLSSLLSKGKESIWIKIHAYSWVLFLLSFFSFKIIQIDYYIITFRAVLYILAVKNSRRHFTRQIIFSKSLLFSTLPPKVQTSPRNTRIFTPEREIKESRQPISFLKESFDQRAFVSKAPLIKSLPAN